MGNTHSSGRNADVQEFPAPRNEAVGEFTPAADGGEATAGVRRRYDGRTQERTSVNRYSGIFDSMRRRNDRRRHVNLPWEQHVTDSADGPPESFGSHLQETQDAVRNEQQMAMRSRRESRFLPDFLTRGLPHYGEDDSTNSETHGPRPTPMPALGHIPTLRERRLPFDLGHRFSLSRAFRRRRDDRTDFGREIRGPFPLGHVEGEVPQTENVLLPERPQSIAVDHEIVDVPPVRRTRIGRMRHSLHLPLTSIFGDTSTRTSAYLPRSPTPHPGQPGVQDDSTSLSSSRHGARRDREGTSHELDAVEPETRNLSTTSRITSGMTSIRRFPGLRSRSTRLIRRGEHPPLSQVLQLAAAAIAAQLSGQSGNGGDGSRASAESFDGSIQNFVQTLQDAASAQAGEHIDLNASEGDLPPVNFMRVFQFPNDENGTPIAPSTTRGSSHSNADSRSSSGGGDGDRSVTLVLVGVRSMPNVQDGSPPEGGTTGPSLDTLLSLPFMPPANVLRNGSSGALFRRSDNRSRTNRRHSMTNFPSSRDGPRLSRTRAGMRNSWADPSLTSSSSNMNPSPVLETPPGPHPPPSTPADVRSGEATPVRQPSTASTAQAQAALLPHLEEDQLEATNGQPLRTTRSETASPGQRRRHDSESVRRPELGSGALRRNGVVEPDRPAAGTGTGTGRSWLIYVVGTNVSPDHPAFAMPSLFTDNPSYEDMQMLSTLLGPVKPPVASRDDVNSAGGTYRLAPQDGLLIATAIEGEPQSSFALGGGERCLICLSEYAAEEEVRQLNACSHTFHRDCIDEWLTTGRNSCPMCRCQGVVEQPSATTAGGS